MKVYVINMNRDQDRMLAVKQQLDALDVSFDRFSAVDATQVQRAELMESVDRFRWWCAVGRPVRIGEIGCALSHYGIYRNLTECPVCVLEDDVILDKRFKEVLDYIEQVINVNHSQVVLLSNHSLNRETGNEPRLVPSKIGMYAEGYVITPKAAQTLIRANLPMQCPCDWWGRWAGRGIIELYHAFPTVCRQDQTRYTSGTVDPSSFNVKNLSWPGFCLHKLKRCVGKSLDAVLEL